MLVVFQFEGLDFFSMLIIFRMHLNGYHVEHLWHALCDV